MSNLLNQIIVKDLGLDALSPEKQEEMLARIGGLVLQAALVRALDLLSEDQQEAFNSYFENHQQDPDAIFKYLETKVPHFNEILEQEAIKFKKDSLDFMNKITNK